MIEHDFQPLPMFGTRQAALAEHDQAWMEVDAKQRDEITGVGGDDGEIVSQGIRPHRHVASAGETDMRDRHGVDASTFRTPESQLGRQVLVEQQLQAGAASPMSMRNGLRGRPGSRLIRECRAA